MEKISTNATVRFFNGKDIPLEMHKVKIVQSISLFRSNDAWRR